MKHHDPSPHIKQKGFSLIELLTAVAIMAILGTVAMPAMKNAITNAQMTRAAANARSIAMGMRAYAVDTDGAFPYAEDEEGNPVSNSNEAFRPLIPYYLDTEKIFALARSNWGKVADGRQEDESDILKAGENHYAYIAGLSDTNNSTWPLIVDGTNGSGQYVTERSEKGGAWEGHKAIVATVGGSVEMIKLKGPRDGERYIPRDGYPEENALDLEYMGDNVTLLEPLEK